MLWSTILALHAVEYNTCTALHTCAACCGVQYLRYMLWSTRVKERESEENTSKRDSSEISWIGCITVGVRLKHAQLEICKPHFNRFNRTNELHNHSSNKLRTCSEKHERAEGELMKQDSN